jgi:peptidoglycan hydrolase CwlO-like protein
MESGGGSAPSTTLHSEAGPSRDSYPGPPNADTNDHGSDSDPDLPPRKKRAPVPVDKKDDRYWERRKKNNIAAKRSRELRRKKIDDELKQAQDAIQENQKLKQEIEVLKAEINSLRRLLKDANMTLSLWIRAKQTAEPNSQLPPMLRGPNVPFVNFPVSSNV